MSEDVNFSTVEQAGDELHVETDGVAVTLWKVRTPNGERLAVCSETQGSTRLDALELESLTWQDADFFAELVEDEYNYRSVDPEPREPASLQISNEYTVIRLNIVNDGETVEVTSPKMGYGTWIDASAFVALIDKPKTFFSELLKTPYGPEDTDHDHVF
jgi:hypothetical protein